MRMAFNTVRMSIKCFTVGRPAPYYIPIPQRYPLFLWRWLQHTSCIDFYCSGKFALGIL